MLARLLQVGTSCVRAAFEEYSALSDDDMLDLVAERAGRTFGGYSVSHVNGRFRAAKFVTRNEAIEMEQSGNESYLVDETTAVVRFILYHRATPQTEQPEFGESASLEEEYERTAWLFHNLFVYAVTKATTNQDQIRLLASGLKHQLFRFVSQDR